MVRIFILKILTVFLLCYVLYAVQSFFAARRKRELWNEHVRNMETTDYDKSEWEKIKKELE